MVSIAAPGSRPTSSSGLVPTEPEPYPEVLLNAEAAWTPLKRRTRPAGVAGAVAYLLRVEATPLSGVDVAVTGLRVMA